MTSILSLVQLYSALYGVDPRLVEAVIKVESNYDPSAISSKGAVGLMQILPKSVHLTRQQLLDPETNIKTGTAYLQKMKQECVHKEDMTWIICYELGNPNAKKVKHPKLWPYYKKIMEVYKKL